MPKNYDKIKITTQKLIGDGANTNVNITNSIIPSNRISYQYVYRPLDPQSLKIGRVKYGINDTSDNNAGNFQPAITLILHHIGRTLNIPATIESPSERVAANYNSLSTLNRSDPIWVYNNSGTNSLSTSFTLHADSFSGGVDAMYQMVKDIKLCTVPAYSGQVVIPPTVSCIIGTPLEASGMDVLTMRGICQGVDVQYNGPYRNNRYMRADVSITIDRSSESTRGIQ